MLRNTRSRWMGCGCLAMAGGGLLVVVAVVVVAVGAWLYADARETNVGELAFENRLQVPPLLEPSIDEDGRKVFDLEFMEGESEFLPGKTTTTWGLNQPYLSPTLRASRGDEVQVNVTNGVDESTSLHWHGMYLPAAMDGGPHQMIDPGETWSPAWTIDQPAATLWFHPHPHGQTAKHVYRGAAGMFLLDDPETDALDLPDEYGVDDVPLIIQDKQFNSSGSFEDGARIFSSVGILGDEILVNGTHSPHFEATTELVRFRVLNASNARLYNLGFTDGREFALIATDSGLLETPVNLTRLQLSPGERAEVVVRVVQGDDVILRSFKPESGLDFFERRFNGGDDTFDILNIRGASVVAESPALPATLVDIDSPHEEDAVATRSITLNGNSRINGERMDMQRIDEVVTVDTTEIWEVSHGGGPYHNLHVHMVHFMVLDIDGEEPPAYLQGWKDTIFLPPGRTARIIMRFEQYTDHEMPYMFHCHILRHEDEGMMGQFVVVEPDSERPTTVPHVHSQDGGHQ